MDKSKGKKAGAAKKPTTKKTVVTKKENSIITTAKDVVNSVANAIPSLWTTKKTTAPVKKKAVVAKKKTVAKKTTPVKNTTAPKKKTVVTKKTTPAKKTTAKFTTRKIAPKVETPKVEEIKIETPITQETKTTKQEKKSKKQEKKNKAEKKIEKKGLIKNTVIQKDIFTFRRIKTYLAWVKAKNLADVLEDLMTEKEIREFAERIEILNLLTKKTPQREIAKNLWISVTTVSRWSKVLQTWKGKIQKYL